MRKVALFYDDKNSLEENIPGQEYKRGIAFQYGDKFYAINLNINKKAILAVDADSENLNAWILKKFGDANPVKAECFPGNYYKRIWRPHWPGPSNYGVISYIQNINKITGSFISLRILLNKLEELFETIEPSVDNLSVYGHKIREILLLACMEVESSWVAVLKENGYQQTMPWKTTDYIKLLSPMFLDCYRLSLRSYPNFPQFSPFENWNVGNPTQSLLWYDSYNKTKHDRENNLRLATLDNAVHAVGAAAVMFYAQFGLNFGVGWDKFTPVIRNIFNVAPDFKKHEHAFYVQPIKLQIDNPPAFSFDWIAIDYPF